MDCTASMTEWIEESKKVLLQLIDTVVATQPGVKVRVAFIGYRDFSDDKQYLVHTFTENVQSIRNFIATV